MTVRMLNKSYLQFSAISTPLVTVTLIEDARSVNKACIGQKTVNTKIAIEYHNRAVFQFVIFTKH